MFFKRKKASPHSELFDTVIEQLKSPESRSYENKLSGLEVYRRLLEMPLKDRAIFLVELPILAKSLNHTFKVGRDDNWSVRQRLTDFFSEFMRRKNEFTPEQLLEMISSIRKHHSKEFSTWGIGWIVNQLGKTIASNGLLDETKQAWLKVSQWDEFSKESYWGADLKKARVKLMQLVVVDGEDIAAYPIGKTNLAVIISADLEVLPDEQQGQWNTLFHAVAQARGAKPSKKFIDSVKSACDDIGASQYKKQVANWLELASKETAFHIEGQEEHWDHGRPDSEIQDLLKGLVWTMVRFHDARTLAVVASLAEKCFERLPSIGPAAPGLGNAAIYMLSNSKGLDGVGHLSRLKLRIKQNNTQKLIQKNIEEQAKKLNLKAAEIEEMAAPDFALVQGIRDFTFDSYTLRLGATEVGQATLSWLKPDGSLQKSVPSFVKEKSAHKAKLAKARALAKDVKKASTAQRDRIDRLFTEDMSWQPESFNKYYIDHGLVGPLARKLVWMLTIDGELLPAIYRDEAWQDSAGKNVVGEPSQFQLWHPIMSETEVVLAWRARLEKLEIKQPFKQTFREVYILTDAEIETRTYSNRMAAHLIKQHQFNSLAAIRGWKYSLMGAYDDGRENEIAQKCLPSYQLTAEFWIDELLDMEDSFNDSGIWDYVATDQVRFLNESGDVLELIDVPPIVLSEIFRDADLFVGVASIGNDPAWSDRGGAPRTNDYWQSYSFGDLGETAKTRKLVLESLLPRLLIRDVAKIEGKYLVVNGKRHSYKIHIGSGNILIMPTDKYLCIVPGRGKDKKVENIYLPFEGDRGLSIVLSKAFMLADDDKIKDETILSQL